MSIRIIVGQAFDHAQDKLPTYDSTELVMKIAAHSTYAQGRLREAIFKSYKSFHPGLMLSINAIFLALEPDLIFFSAAIAS
ncbi:MAG: hypothetical protein ACYS80_13370 [Planctomycetota bacterium]